MEFSEKQDDIFLPISIKLTNKKILVIGGGRIACHKINFLEQFTKNISVVALKICDNIKAKGYSFKEKPYEKSDLEGAFLAYACSNIKELNQQIKIDAENLGILTNVVDDPSLCDFISPAIYKRDHMTIAVGSNGQDVRRAIAVRNKIRENLENDNEVFYNSVNKIFMSSLISIVGAGPGDPELLTIKALKRIQEADIILHDALVSNEILNLARPDVQRFYVGKIYQDGQNQTGRQEWINQLIIDLSKKGQKIVRLKSGDPMIFGRGAEEIRFCIENKLNYEVIPGITSALGAASLYGIPLTERGKNSMVLFGTGHYCEGDFCDMDSFVSVLKSGSPIIFFMGLNKLVQLAQRLMDQSISSETKVQILSKVSQPDATSVEGTLETISQVIENKKPPMPALVIIGRNAVRLNVLGSE